MSDGRLPSDAHESLGATGELEWERLRKDIELQKGFWLAFLFCSSPKAADLLRDRAKRMIRGQAREFCEIRPTGPEEMRQVLPILLGRASSRVGCTWLSAVRADGPGVQGDWALAWDELLLRMNERRDALRRHLVGGLVLVGTESLKPKVRDVAPDLWSVRSLVLELPAISQRGDGGFVDPFTETIFPWEKSTTRPYRSDLWEMPTSHGLDLELPPDPSFALAEAARQEQRRGAGGIANSAMRLRAIPGLLAGGQTRQAVHVARDVVDALRSEPGVSEIILADALAHLAEAEEADGDLAAAAEHIERAIDKGRGARPEDQVKWHHRAGNIALARSDVRYAVAAYERMVDIARQLVGVQGESFAALRELEASLNKLSDAQFRMGDFAAAAAAAEESLGIAREMSKRYANKAEVARGLSISLNRVGNASLRAGDLAAASAAYEESLALRRRLRKERGDQPEVLRDLSLGLNRLGMVRGRSGDSKAAAVAYEESLQLRRDLRRIQGDTPEVLRDLSVVLSRLGDLRRDGGMLVEAARAYQESLELVRRVLEVGGESLDTLRDLSLALSRFGEVRHLARDLLGAARAYEECVDLMRRIRDAQGDVGPVHGDFAENLGRLGAIRLAQGDLPRAVSALEDAAAAARKLMKLHATPDASRLLQKILGDLAASQRRLGDDAGASATEAEAASLRVS